MRIDAVCNTNFSSKTVAIDKVNLVKIGNKKDIGIKPIKNFAQYIKEYGLDIKSRKK